MFDLVFLVDNESFWWGKEHMLIYNNNACGFTTIIYVKSGYDEGHGSKSAVCWKEFKFRMTIFTSVFAV